MVSSSRATFDSGLALYTRGCWSAYTLEISQDVQAMILNRKEVSYVRLFVGLDVSSFDMKVCFLNGEGEKLDSFSVSN